MCKNADVFLLGLQCSRQLYIDYLATLAASQQFSFGELFWRGLLYGFVVLVLCG